MAFKKINDNHNMIPLKANDRSHEALNDLIVCLHIIPPLYYTVYLRREQHE